MKTHIGMSLLAALMLAGCALYEPNVNGVGALTGKPTRGIECRNAPGVISQATSYAGTMPALWCPGDVGIEDAKVARIAGVPTLFPPSVRPEINVKPAQ